MTKIYGRKGGKQNPMPVNYDTETKLFIKNNALYAEGQWLSTYDFLLKKDSLIRNRGHEQGEGIKNIKKQLKDEKLIFERDKYSFLLADIHLYSPSAAARLVLGQQSNGHMDWRDSSDKPLSAYLAEATEFNLK